MQKNIPTLMSLPMFWKLENQIGLAVKPVQPLTGGISDSVASIESLKLAVESTNQTVLEKPNSPISPSSFTFHVLWIFVKSPSLISPFSIEPANQMVLEEPNSPISPSYFTFHVPIPYKPILVMEPLLLALFII